MSNTGALGALERLLALGWRIEMSEHLDRSLGAPTPAPTVFSVRLRKAPWVLVTGKGATLSEAFAEASQKAAKAEEEHA